MLLHRIHLNLRCREARRDLADPYQLHATLGRAFSPPDVKLPPAAVLWRLEPETDGEGNPRVIVQTQRPSDWSRIGVPDWLAAVDPPLDISARLGLDVVAAGQRFRFRLRANPCVTRQGKRIGLMRLAEQEGWIARQSSQHGFALPAIDEWAGDESTERRPLVRVSHEQMLTGRQHGGNRIRIFSVMYDGVLTVTDPARFTASLQSGIGHGKALGLGLLSVAPIRS